MVQINVTVRKKYVAIKGLVAAYDIVFGLFKLSHSFELSLNHALEQYSSK